MKIFRIAIVTVLLISNIFCFGQGESIQKTKIALLGTVHFEPSTSDVFSNDELIISGAKRQREITEVLDKLEEYNPSKICVEYPLENQRSLDSVYHAFLEGKYELQDDEIDQLGFNLAKRLDLVNLIAINHKGNFEMDTVMRYAQSNGQAHILKKLEKHGNAFMAEINNRLKTSTISDFLIYLNSESILNSNAEFYSNYISRIGKGRDYIGTELISDWYETNLRIYTNILRQVDATDDSIIVIFGQGHIPIIRHLFESNSDFELVEIANLLSVRE